MAQGLGLRKAAGTSVAHAGIYVLVEVALSLSCDAFPPTPVSTETGTSDFQSAVSEAVGEAMVIRASAGCEGSHIQITPCIRTARCGK